MKLGKLNSDGKVGYANIAKKTAYIYIYSKLTNKIKVIIQQLVMCKKITVVARKLNRTVLHI